LAVVIVLSHRANPGCGRDRTEGRAEPSAPEPELAFGGRLDLQGASEVRADARGTPAIMALQRVLIVLSPRPPRHEPARRPCLVRRERDGSG
jgi:hypothetical protein